MNTGLTKRNYFRQAPELVNSKFTLSNAESNLFYVLLTEIDKDDEEFKDYTFTKKELEIKLGIKIHTSQLRNTARSLMQKVFEIYKGDNNWEMFGFSYFAYKNSTITCRFDKGLKPYLLDLKQYAVADIRHLLQMKGLYSKRIYLMLKAYDKVGHRRLEIDELMRQLEVKKSYQRYDNFKRKVLIQAVSDINKFSDLEIQNLGDAKKPKYFEEHKPSRKITAITFYFKKNWNDIKAFIKTIRELYSNELLYENKEGKALKCSDKGLLYYSDDMKHINQTESIKLWEYLHENREKLICFQENLLDDEEIIKKLKGK